jgi:hypothetical protein
MYCSNQVYKEFLGRNYLREKYHVPPKVDKTAKIASEKLIEKYSNFIGLCLVGGLTNGSNTIRGMEQEKRPKSFFSKIFGASVASDVDLYLLINNVSKRDLNGMADVVAKEFETIGLSIDGVLNGRNPSNAFNVSRIDRYIDNEDYDLLSLPFKYVRGKEISEVQKAIAEAVKTRLDSQTIWGQIKFYHDSTLALYHGTFDQEFMDYIYNNWLPRKVKKFGLPPLEEML